MSNEDISMVCDVLLGITNPDKELRTKSVNKLQELSNNLGALTYCLIDIASKTATNDKEKIVKTTALVLCRKILDTKKSADWEKIDKDLKEKIKINTLNLLNSETDPSQNAKVCDLVVAMFEKIMDLKNDWPQMIQLALSVTNYDPNDNTKIVEKECRKGCRGCVQCKKELIEAMNNFLKPIQERRKKYDENPQLVEEILNEGTKNAQKKAKEVMQKVKKAMKIDY